MRKKVNMSCFFMFFAALLKKAYYLTKICQAKNI